jgi:hypothetical protein
MKIQAIYQIYDRDTGIGGRYPQLVIKYKLPNKFFRRTIDHCLDEYFHLYAKDIYKEVYEVLGIDTKWRMEDTDRWKLAKRVVDEIGMDNIIAKEIQGDIISNNIMIEEINAENAALKALLSKGWRNIEVEVDINAK